MSTPATPTAASREGTRSRRARTWPRRLVTIPTVFALTALSTLLLPAAALLAGLADGLRHRPWPLLRTVAFMTGFLWAESLGVVAAFAIWCRWGLSPARRDAFLAANHRLQHAWIRGIFALGRRLYGFTVEIEGADALAAPGPVLVLVRHASTADTVLPVVLLADHGFVFRYVLKQELLFDPCLDIVGHRLPNVFVRRGTGRTEDEVARVRQLAAALGPRDAVVIFPEGTRFTPRKRQALLARLETAGDAEALALARELRATLSPLRRGSVTLIEAAPDAAVVVIAHTGLEAAGALSDFLAGGLIGARLRIRVRRWTPDAVPRDAQAARRFLADAWRQVDDFVAPRPESASEPEPSSPP